MFGCSVTPQFYSVFDKNTLILRERKNIRVYMVGL
jgi:hypothetical protein